MDYKKTNAPATTVTRDMMELCADTGNVYETVAIIGKRANQISVEIKNDLSKKLAEFASYNDNLEEVFENREQIEISRYYEKLPKPVFPVPQQCPQVCLQIHIFHESLHQEHDCLHQMQQKFRSSFSNFCCNIPA